MVLVIVHWNVFEKLVWKVGEGQNLFYHKLGLKTHSNKNGFFGVFN